MARSTNGLTLIHSATCRAIHALTSQANPIPREETKAPPGQKMLEKTIPAPIPRMPARNEISANRGPKKFPERSPQQEPHDRRQQSLEEPDAMRRATKHFPGHIKDRQRGKKHQQGQTLLVTFG